MSSPVTTARGGGGTAGTGVVTANDLTTFTNESISGGAVTAYNAAGTPVNLQLRWAKTDSASLGAGHQDSWNLFYQTETTATGTQTAWVNTGTNFTFSANGSLFVSHRLVDQRSRRDRRRAVARHDSRSTSPPAR